MSQLAPIESLSAPPAPILPEERAPRLAPVRASRARALTRAVAPASRGLVLAASGFLTGAAVVGLVGRHRAHSSLARGARGTRAPSRRARRGHGPRVEPIQILGTRSLLLDIHLLGGAER